MKKIILRIGFAIIAAQLFYTKVSAQTLIPPMGVDVNWTPGGVPVNCGINTAMIDYPLEHPTPNFPIGRLAGCVYGGAPGGVIVTDLNSGVTHTLTYPVVFAGSPLGGCADIIIGNNMTSLTPGQDFILATSFVSLWGQIEVDFFDIHFLAPGGGAFNFTYHSTQLLPLPPGWINIATVHLDVVAQSSNTTLYGLPLCDQFFVTYDGQDVGAGLFNVFATFGRLSSYNAMLAGPVNISRAVLPTSDGYQPDVAGIERGPIGGTRPIACIAHVCQCDHTLFYSEWDPFGVGVLPFSTIGPASVWGPNISAYNRPRIDADDNCFTNTLGGLNQKIQVASEFVDPVSGTFDIRVYDPYNPAPPPLPGGTALNWADFSFLPPGFGSRTVFNPYQYFLPTVAFGPVGPLGSEFMVNECVHLPSLIGGPPNDFFIMNPMNSNAMSLAPAPSTALDYFVENSMYPATSMNSANSVSTPCNNVADISLVAWTNAGNIYYKTNIFGGPNGYNYRRSAGSSAGTNNVSLGEELVRVFPNPSTGHLVINNPVGVNADRYSIKNVLGQVVNSGYITIGDNDLVLNDLPEGNYVICSYKGNEPTGNTMFVKR